MNNQVTLCLDKIAQLNDELKRLTKYPEEANARVSAPYPYNSQTITKKNQIVLERDRQINILRQIFSGYNIGIRSNAHSGDNYAGPRYLAFIDILGFSEIVRNNSHEDLTRFVNFLIRDVQSYMAAEEVGKTNNRLYTYGFAPDLSEASLNSLMLSDTILYWTKDDSAESFYEIVKSIRNLMYFETMYTNVALRGVITIGELSFLDFDLAHPTLTINQSTLYGKAIVDAYHTEGKQEWMGCIVTSKAIGTYISKGPLPEKIEKVFKEFLIEYNVPMKGNCTEKQNVIKWPGKQFEENDRQCLKKCFTRHQKHEDITNASVLAKYENTVKFAEYVSQSS